MRSWFLFFAVLIGLELGQNLFGEEDLSPAQIKNLKTIFIEANEFMLQKDYRNALRKYYEGMDLFPEAEGLLYNGGLAAFQAGEYEEALNFWRKLKSTNPQDWQVRAKLIQTYQALKEFKERDAERDALFELRKMGHIPALKLAEFYVREQTEFAGQKVIVLEYFELKGETPLRYSFVILDENDQPKSKITFGPYENTNQLWLERDPQKSKRAFHLNGHFNEGYEAYEIYSEEPSYDKIRLRVKKILETKF